MCVCVRVCACACVCVRVCARVRVCQSACCVATTCFATVQPSGAPLPQPGLSGSAQVGATDVHDAPWPVILAYSTEAAADVRTVVVQVSRIRPCAIDARTSVHVTACEKTSSCACATAAQVNGKTRGRVQICGTRHCVCVSFVCPCVRKLACLFARTRACVYDHSVDTQARAVSSPAMLQRSSGFTIGYARLCHAFVGGASPVPVQMWQGWA